MSAMRERAKEHFPAVLLTLLSIVQALALELLWSHLGESDYLFALNWIAVLAWIQVFATLLGIMLIWVIYASNVMRFRWVPRTGDMVIPFLIGLIEFMLVETLGPDSFGPWFLLMAIVFTVMNWVAHITLRRARFDVDNEEFFRNREPATWRDFVPAMYSIGFLALCGAYLWRSGDQGTAALLALLLVTGLLAFQFGLAARFWNQSVVEEQPAG